MNRIAIGVYVIILAGCSTESISSGPISRGPGQATEVEDGGGVKNVDRDKTNEYFVALGKVESAEDEAKLLQEFGGWLRENGYSIKVEADNGKHNLSCPYFPPVTPWTSHTFFDLQNLKLLPQSENG